MVEIRIYPEKNLACICVEAGSESDNIFLCESLYAENAHETDGEWTYYRVPLDKLMSEIKRLPEK